MTFSIAARSADGRSWGVAVASKFLGVGAAVPAARAGVGAIATQSYANTSFKRRGLELLARGTDATATLDTLLADDRDREQRQVGVVDADGRAATFTGSGCHAWAGGRTQDAAAIQGNILVGPQVLDAVAGAWKSPAAPGIDAAADPGTGHGAAAAAALARSLLRALQAGDGAGGDRRGRQSAALLVVREGAGYGGFDDVAVDLRVDDHPAPCTEMERLLGLHELYNVPPDPATLLPLTPELDAEVTAAARRLGHERFAAWVGSENFENRAWPDRVDPQVLQILRDQVRRP